MHFKFQLSFSAGKQIPIKNGALKQLWTEILCLYVYQCIFGNVKYRSLKDVDSCKSVESVRGDYKDKE